jgi:hypothetical protein
MQSEQKQHILKAVEQIQRTNEAHIIIRYKKGATPCSNLC